MVLLSRKKDVKDVVVGTKVPCHTFEYLTLYCIAKKVSKSSIFRPFIDTWVKEHKQEDSERDLVLEIINLVSQRWAYEKVNNRKADPLVFRAKMKRELLVKGLSEYYINIIIKTIK